MKSPHLVLLAPALLFLAACSGAYAAALDLAALPVFNAAKVRYEGDWLVQPPEQGAQLYRSESGRDLVLSNGLIARRFRLEPNVATVAFDHLAARQSLLRGVKPEAIVELNGVRFNVGGLKGQPNYAFLRPAWEDTLEPLPGSLRFTGFEAGPIEAPFPWKRVRHCAPDATWPPGGLHLRMDYAMPATGLVTLQPGLRGVRVSVHYALYDGLPVLSKWLTLENQGDEKITLDRFTSEILAAVEYSSEVEDRGVPFSTPNFHVETDYAFGGMCAANTSKHAVHWVPDPDYATQVNYQRQNPCLLELRPEMGPAIELAPGERFESFRAYIMPRDSYDRERNGLAQRRMYRTIAPWSTENPLMMHVRFADWDAVRLAIDQCAEVGFEMVILTFGSGFNLENDTEAYRQEMRRYTGYAHEKGVELGGYSLLASRSIDAENDVVMPEGQSPTFGHSPCLGSPWGTAYFDLLYRFYKNTGFDLLEHDGSYPGDPCMSTQHPGHKGLDDSRWRQWRRITDFYKWCRETGVYLNVPDYYYLSGANKCGMGYRETNWSLPRAQQVIHTRQNIYDGTWTKTPSMGWMFVPLTEYHGGGAAATIEPLDEHIGHYERMLAGNLAFGVQACYRGPRLYDTEAVRSMVSEQVAWYKSYRAILESDLIHGRRADGRGIDWMLHVNPALENKGMLLVFNPLEEAVERTLDVNLYYTGIEDTARVREREGAPAPYPLARDYGVSIPVRLEAQGWTWFVIEE